MIKFVGISLALLSFVYVIDSHTVDVPNTAEAKVDTALIETVTVQSVKIVAVKKPENKTLKKLIEYYKVSGSRYPAEMAEAVLITKRPKLMAAMSVVESDGNYTVRGGGYKKMHDGAWQVNPKYWGEVPNSAHDQALQAEHALETFLNQTGDLTKALNKYGGCSQGKYSSSIYAEMKNVPDAM